VAAAPRNSLGPLLARFGSEKGLKVDVIASRFRAHGCNLCPRSLRQATGAFLPCGDGTATKSSTAFLRTRPVQRVALGFLPLVTGNSFLRDFTKDGAAASMAGTLEGRTRTVDLLRLTHAAWRNLFFQSSERWLYGGCPATLAIGLFTRWILGYVAAACSGAWCSCAAILGTALATTIMSGTSEPLFLTFNNSKYTGRHDAHRAACRPTDGSLNLSAGARLVRLGLLRTLQQQRLTTVLHIELRRFAPRVRHVEFKAAATRGHHMTAKSSTLECRALDILPAALYVSILNAWLLPQHYSWTVSGLISASFVPRSSFFGIFLDPREKQKKSHDWLPRVFFRRIAFSFARRSEVRRAAGFDAQRTSFFCRPRHLFRSLHALLPNPAVCPAGVAGILTSIFPRTAGG